MYKTFTITDENRKYHSLLDEFRRNKSLNRSKIFFISNKQIFWEAFLRTFKKTFKLNYEIKEKLNFNNIVDKKRINYKIEKFDQKLNYLPITWFNNKDQYWLEYRIVDLWYSKNKKT